jgi:hypothetical protein
MSNGIGRLIAIMILLLSGPVNSLHCILLLLQGTEASIDPIPILGTGFLFNGFVLVVTCIALLKKGIAQGELDRTAFWLFQGVNQASVVLSFIAIPVTLAAFGFSFPVLVNMLFTVIFGWNSFRAVRMVKVFSSPGWPGLIAYLKTPES